MCYMLYIYPVQFNIRSQTKQTALIYYLIKTLKVQRFNLMSYIFVIQYIHAWLDNLPRLLHVQYIHQLYLEYM